jgi:hypothetical protein
MAVGAIGGISIRAYSNYITVAFAKPANTTKYLVTVVNADNGFTAASQYFSFSSSSVGSTVTCTVNSLNAGYHYLVYVTPYNGTTAGTRKQYTNASTTNVVNMPGGTITATTTNGAGSSQSSVTNAGSTSKTSQASQTGGGANGGSTVAGTGAGTNTPGGPTDATATWVAGTVGSKPTDLGNVGRVPLKISGLDLNQTYSITVTAVTTDVDGNTIHSEPSAALIVNTPPTTISGSNFSNSNIGTDSQLSGGSIFAGSFPANSGLIDVVNGTTTGTGVILNQTGLAAFNQGIKEFYIDAVTGKAYFAGTVTAGTVKIGPNVDPTGTKTGIYINDQNYWYQDGTWSAKGSDIAGALTSSSYLSMPKPPGVTNLVGTWTGTDFKLTFDDDTSTAPSGYTNSYFSYFLVKLVGNSGTHTFTAPASSGLHQSFALSLAQNRAAFGVPQVAFSGSVIAVDAFGNESAEVTFAQVSYASPLTTPTVNLTATTGGYSVSYTSQSSSAFLNATVYEVESNSTTDPVAGYQVVAQSSSNPITYVTPNYNQRWVKVRLYDALGGYPTFSTPAPITPLSAVGADNVGPANVSNAGLVTTSGIDLSGGLGFNGYINLSWTAVSDTSLRGYRIRFTTDAGANPQYSYVDSPGTGTSYKLTGLAVGATYKLAIATYDEFNNTSTNYVSYSDVTIAGTPSVSNYITAGSNQFQFGSGVGGNTTNQGLYFNANNYWYVNSGTSALFKLGGSTSNYLSWDGSNFVIDGDLRARKGYFAGNVEIKSGISGGASIFSGTLNGSGNLTSAGFILNSSGLTFSNATTSGITTIDATSGTFTTKSAVIGGWQVATTANTIYKNSTAGTVTLDSDNARIDIANSSGNYHLAISSPTAGTSGTSYVAWAGAASNTAAGIEAAKFKVAQDGTLYASGAVFSGYALSSDLSAYATTSSLNAYATNVNLSNGTTTISGNNIKTGAIDLNLAVVRSSATGARIELTSAGLKNYAAGNSTPTVEINTDGSAYFRGNLTGNNITGATITGSSLQTSNTGNGYISIPGGDTINFYAPGTTQTSPGYINMTQFGGSSSLFITPPTNSGWADRPYFSTYAVSTGSFASMFSSITSVSATSSMSISSNGLFSLSATSGYILVNTSVLGMQYGSTSAAPSIGAFRNIYASGGTPAGTDGQVGDIWLEW